MPNDFIKYESCPCNSQRCLLNALQDLKNKERGDVYMHKYRICLPCKIKYDLIANTIEPQLVLTKYPSLRDLSESIGKNKDKEEMRVSKIKQGVKKRSQATSTRAEQPPWFPRRCDTNRDPNYISIKPKKAKSRLLMATISKKQGANHIVQEPPLDSGHSTRTSSTSSYDTYQGGPSKAAAKKSVKYAEANTGPTTVRRKVNCENATSRPGKGEGEEDAKEICKEDFEKININITKQHGDEPYICGSSRVYCRFSGKFKFNLQTEERFCFINFDDDCNILVNSQPEAIEIMHQYNECVCKCDDCGQFCNEEITECVQQTSQCCNCCSPCSGPVCDC